MSKSQTQAMLYIRVRHVAGVFRSVWKVGSRWSSVDRLFEPRVSLSGCFQGGQNEETFEFRFQEQMQNGIPFSRFCFPFHLSLSLFSIPSRWILDSILSTRDKLRDGAELLNLCLLINPTRSPHEIFISLVPRLFALVNLQSLAFKESLKISLQTWKKLLCENVILAGLFRIVEIEMDQWWWRKANKICTLIFN